MARKLKAESYDTGLFDSASGISVKTRKALDVTIHCPLMNKKSRCIFLFMRVRRGRVVQILQPFGGLGNRGSRIHFFVDELQKGGSIPGRSDTLNSTAEELGLSKEGLIALIRQLAPGRR